MNLNDLISNLMGLSRTPIDRTEVGPYTVSTVDTSDYGPETAIIDSDDNIYPVERYKDCELAKIGHKKWIKFLKNAKPPIKITRLGCFTGDKDVLLVIKK